jgi:phosphohistidine phosphatase
MPILTLVRHAKSAWDYPELTDFERPLNDRGRRDAPRMAQRALALPKVSRIISSPATRALTTARVFAEHLGIPFDAIRIEPRIYDASRKTLLEVVTQIEQNPAHLMLFGHNPGFSELAHTLGHCPFDEMPTCAIAHFKLDVKTWKDIAPGTGSLVTYLFPKDGLG